MKTQEQGLCALYPERRNGILMYMLSFSTYVQVIEAKMLIILRKIHHNDFYC